MYVYTFHNSLYPREVKIITTNYPVRDRELLMNLANDGPEWKDREKGNWTLVDIIH